MARKLAPPPRGLPLDDRALAERERSIPLLFGSLLARVVEGAKNDTERRRAREAYSVAYDAARVLLGSADEWQRKAVERMAKARGDEPPLPSREVEIIGGIVEDHARLVQSAPEGGKSNPALAMLDALRGFALPLLDRLREPAALDSLVAILARVRETDEVEGRRVRSKRRATRGARKDVGPDARTLGSATVEILVLAGGLRKLAGEKSTSTVWRRTVYDFDRKLRRARKTRFD